MFEATKNFTHYKIDPENPLKYHCQENWCGEEVRKQDIRNHSLLKHLTTSISVDSPLVQPVHYKLLDSGDVGSVLKFRCQSCKEIRGADDLRHHALVSHGTSEYTADTIIRNRE